MDKLILVVALTPIKYRGKRIEEAGEFECHENDIEPMLSDSLIAFSEYELPATDDVTSANQRIIDIIGVIISLDENDESLWTQDGKPKTDAIEADDSIDYQVSAALRDEAWEKMHETVQ